MVFFHILNIVRVTAVEIQNFSDLEHGLNANTDAFCNDVAITRFRCNKSTFDFRCGAQH